MIWWASQPSRARRERREIADLEERNEWLNAVTWRLTEDVRLCADFTINHLGAAVPLELTYPSFFPDMPPQVRPQSNEVLSGHQYGAGGELCLEYRPDNWDPSFTGAMMIESARRLLEGEEPSPGERAEVASAHRTTQGQEVRSAYCRFVLSERARAALTVAPFRQAIPAEIVEHYVARQWVAFPQRVGGADAPYWDAGGELPPLRARKGFYVRLNPDLSRYIGANYTFLGMLVALLGSEDVSTRFAGSEEELFFLLECDNNFKMMTLAPGAGDRTVHDYRTVDAPEETGRLPADYERLAATSVAVVGCGSVGSKIAASLARAGVGTFVLVDGDLLFPGNLVRNDLDWRAVGLNKPDAVAERISQIRPSAAVTTRRIDLGGQESSASTEAALVAVGACDLIVDATAVPQVFNLCAAIARNERRPLVFGEVFGGGIGGIVARLRPERDPTPHAARRQILEWCADRGEPPPATASAYGLAQVEGAPLVADDADVTVIAAHMTRLVLDTLLRGDSAFPQSAYAVGLKTGWIFQAPFDTWPISLVEEGRWGPDEDERPGEELAALAAELFPSTPPDAGE